MQEAGSWRCEQTEGVFGQLSSDLGRIRSASVFLLSRQLHRGPDVLAYSSGTAMA
jgi:hypothetical protein